MSVATFKLRVACDLYGSKHNAMFLFKPPPVALSEVTQEAQRFYTEEAEKRRPAGHVGPSFQVSSLQVYNAATTQWEDVYDLSQLIDGCQLYAFQHQALMTQPAEPTPVHAPAEVPQQPAPPQQPAALNWSQPATCDGTRTGIAFSVLDTKRDGVITLDEMTEAFRALHLRFTPNQVQDLFVVADEDRDNVVSREEFDRFAVRFPTVIDSIHQKRFDDEVMAREEAVLAEAEKALEAEQEAESRLMHESQAASKRVRDLMAQIADHRLSHEVQLQRKPVVDAQQQQLIEQELALAAQKERLKQAQEDLRRDIEDQLAQVSQNLGIAVPAGEQAARGSEPASLQQQLQQQQQQQGVAAGDARLGSVSENSSSFFLPSERTEADPRAQADVHREESPPPPPAALRLAVGAEVEACNFETKPEFNGLRGKVTALKDDGKVAVEFCIRGGLNLDMLPSNIRPVVPATNPALWQEVEAAGPANSVGGIVDLRGEKGRVVGFRGETLLCEFAPRPGIFELPTHSLVQQQQQQQQQTQNPFSLQEAVAREVAQAAQDAGKQQPSAQQPSAQQDLAAELEQARRETTQLKAELAAERTRRGEANVRSPLARTAPDSAAALTRLAGLSQSPTAGAVPGVYPASPLAGFPPTAHHFVGHAGLAAETVRELGSNALLPSTQEILRRVGASIAPSDHRSPSLLPPAPTSMSTKLKAYSLGPIDPSTL